MYKRQVLYKGELRLYGVREQEELSEESYREIMQEVLPKRATLRCMNLLQSRAYTAVSYTHLDVYKRQGLVWIRLLYCYPEEITEELIQVMKEQPKVCHYLDMPIQHASDKILAKMGRKTRKEELEGIIAKLREEIPDICLRTTCLLYTSSKSVTAC